jgi:hypothetical protein
MNISEIFVPTVLTTVRTIDPGEIRAVTLALPQEYEVEGKTYPIRDSMRPGNAFLARPLGARTGKMRRRMYTRSNCALSSERLLETIINHTHEVKADTSIWWQTEEVEALHRAGGTIDVRVDVSPDKTHLVLYENSAECKPANLRLEPDDQWPGMRFVAIALSTGITPFLAHLRYMKAFNFGRAHHPPGCHITLIASARNPGQLMEHDELLELSRQFPENFRYYPVLTREWPADWPYGRGRIIQVTGGHEGERQVDLQSILDIVPDIEHCHVRLCGNASAREQLTLGLRQKGYQVPSLRSEVW